jgi:hypothetical protein
LPISRVIYICDLGGNTIDGVAIRVNGLGNDERRNRYMLYKASAWQTVIAYLDNSILIGAAWGPTLPANWSLVGR